MLSKSPPPPACHQGQVTGSRKGHNGEEIGGMNINEEETPTNEEKC